MTAIPLRLLPDTAKIDDHGALAIGGVPIAEAVARIRTVPPKGQFVHHAREIGICFGD